MTSSPSDAQALSVVGHDVRAVTGRDLVRPLFRYRRWGLTVFVSGAVAVAVAVPVARRTVVAVAVAVAGGVGSTVGVAAGVGVGKGASQPGKALPSIWVPGE